MSDETSPVVDVWANWWDSDFFAASPMMRDLYRRLKLDDRMKLGVEEIVAEAQVAGVDRIVISATAFDGSPATNAAVHTVVQSHPETLAGCASVDPRSGMAAVAELRQAVEIYGFIGLKLLPFLVGLPPNHAVYYPLYATCVELGIPALVLTGHTAVALPNETGRPGYLDDVALHFPELTLVAGHAGYPWTTELISLAWKHPNLFIDTSGHRPKYLPPELLRFVNGHGRRKVLFGTGYPLMDYAGPLSEVAELDLKQETVRALLGGNAARIWPQMFNNGDHRHS